MWVRNKPGIYDGGVPGITLGIVDISKIGGDEGSRKVLLGGSCEGERYGNLEDGREDLEES